LMVTDSGAHEIRIFDAAGVFRSATGRVGQGPGEYGDFSSMRLYGPTASGLILVGDTLNDRLNVVDPDGVYQTQLDFGDAPNAAGPSLLSLFADDSWLVQAVDGDNRLGGEPGSIIRMRYQLLRFTAEGQFTEVLGYADATPRYVNEVEGVTNFPFIPLSAAPQAVAVGDLLWTATGAEPRIRATDFDGVEVATISWELPDRIRTEDVYARYTEAELETMAGDARGLRMYGHLYRQDLPLSEYIPVHREMLADAEGNIWLERYRLPWETQPRWDVVDPERGWLGVIETPVGLRVMQVTAGEVVGMHRDDAGVSRVRTYELTKPGR
jgi:hypothetical protein